MITAGGVPSKRGDMRNQGRAIKPCKGPAPADSKQDRLFTHRRSRAERLAAGKQLRDASRNCWPCATVPHSLAVDYLREHHAQVLEYSTVDQLFKALLDKKVDAVVTGAPILRYYAAHEGKGQVKMVGSEINIAPVAIMVQLNSPLRKKIDIALLALRENGSYQQLYDKWFGSP